MGWGCWHTFPVLQVPESISASHSWHPTVWEPGHGQRPGSPSCPTMEAGTWGPTAAMEHHCRPCTGPHAQGLSSRLCALCMQRGSHQSLSCVHNSCWPPPSPPRHSSEPRICRASPGCSFDALFLNNSQIFKQHFCQHCMFRRHAGMSRVPELAGPRGAQPCSSVEWPAAHTSSCTAPGKQHRAFSTQREGSCETGWVCTVWLSETPSLSYGLDWILRDNKSPKSLLKTSISNFWSFRLCDVSQPLADPLLQGLTAPFWLTKLCWFWERLWAQVSRLTQPVLLSHSSVKKKSQLDFSSNLMQI